MKIIGISVIKNESDIIESFVRLNLRILDELHIIDDGSSDETISIINNMIDDGYNIYIHEKIKNKYIFHQQSFNMTLLLNKLHNKIWDYAFLLDADEFILSGRNELEYDLNSIGCSNYGLLRWQNFVTTSVDFFGSLDPLHELFRPCSQGDKVFYKLVVPHGLAAETVVSQGNHSADNACFRQGNWRELKTRLGHVPIRSVPQALSKYIVGSYILSVKQNRIGNDGYHKYEILDEIRNRKYRLNLVDLQKLVNHYSGFKKHKAPTLYNSPLIDSVGELKYKIDPDIYSFSIIDNALHEISKELVRKQYFSRKYLKMKYYVKRIVDKFGRFWKPF